MKVKKITQLLFPVIIVLTGCNKFDLFEDKSPVLPNVRMITAESYDDTTLLIAEVTDEGSSPVYVCGFCYDTAINGKPGFKDQQILLNGTEGKFGVYLTDLVSGMNYAFIAFASNKEGYSFSNVMTCDASSPLPPNIPCDFPDNTIIDGGSWTITDVETGYGFTGYSVRAFYKYDLQIEFTFNDIPENGIYNTCDYNSIDAVEKNVYVAVKTYYLGSYEIYKDGIVYVERTDEQILYITFCDLVYSLNSNDFQIKGRIKTD